MVEWDFAVMQLFWGPVVTVVGYFDCTVTFQTANKVYLESGGGVSNQLTRISHSEANNLNREDTQEEFWLPCGLAQGKRHISCSVSGQKAKSDSCSELASFHTSL